QASPPLDPRRLATAAMAAALGAARGRELGAQPAVDAVARQARRQPASKPGPGRDDRAAGAGMAAGPRCVVMDAVGAVHPGGAARARVDDQPGRPTAGPAAARPSAA